MSTLDALPLLLCHFGEFFARWPDIIYVVRHAVFRVVKLFLQIDIAQQGRVVCTDDARLALLGNVESALDDITFVSEHVAILITLLLALAIRPLYRLGLFPSS